MEKLSNNLCLSLSAQCHAHCTVSGFSIIYIRLKTERAAAV